MDEPATAFPTMRSEAVTEMEAEDALVFNRDDLLRRLSNNTEVVARLLEIFLDSTPERLMDVERHLEAGDVGKVVHAVHTLKGAAANIGGEAMLAVTRDMEAAGYDADLDRVRVMLPALKAEYARLVAALRAEDD